MNSLIVLAEGSTRKNILWSAPTCRRFVIALVELVKHNEAATSRRTPKLLLHPRAWMKAIVRRTQMHVRNMRVDLRSGDVAMAQQRLYRTRVSAVLQQVSRKTMPQRVG